MKPCPGVEFVTADFDDPTTLQRALDCVDCAQLHAAADSPVRYLRYHAVVEEAIRASGMMFTNLRPNLYMQGLLGFRQSIVSERRFFAPAGDARVSIVDVRDIAAVAARALTESGHDGKTYDLTGPEALTQQADGLIEDDAHYREGRHPPFPRRSEMS